MRFRASIWVHFLEGSSILSDSSFISRFRTIWKEMILLTVEAGATTLFRASDIEGRNALIGIAIPLLVNLHAGIGVGRKINQMGHGRPVRCHSGHIGLRKDLAFNFLKVGIELTDRCRLEHLDHGMVEVVWDERMVDRIL